MPLQSIKLFIKMCL